MATIASLIVDIGANTATLVSEARKANDTIESIGSTATKMAGVLGVAFSAQALIGFGRQLMDDADQLTKLHDKTNLSVEALQRFRIAGDDAGNTVEDLAGAITKMQVKIAGNDSSAESGLRKLGVAFDDFRTMSPEQQMYAVSDAIQGIRDPAEQAKIAVDLFGKKGAEILPTLKRGFDDVKDSAVGMSADTVKALDDAGDTLKRWGTAAAAAAGDWIVKVAYDIEGLGIPALKRYEQSLRDAAQVQQQLADMAKKAGPPKLFQDAGNLPTQFTAAAGAVESFTREMAKAQQAQEQAAAAQKKLNDELKKFNDNTADVMLRSQGVAAVLDTIDGKVVEGTRYFIAHGDSLEKVAEMYGLTKTQAETLGEQFKMEALVAKAAAEYHGELITTFYGLNEGLRPLPALLDDEARALALDTIQVHENMVTRNALADAIAKQNIPLPGGGLAGKGGTQFKVVGDGFAAEFGGAVQDYFDSGKFAHVISQGLTGGGGLAGAVKAAGTEIGQLYIKSMEDQIAAKVKSGALTAAQARNAGIGVAAGTAGAGAIGEAAGGNTGAEIASVTSGLAGAALAATAWGSSMAAAGVVGAVALSAATLGIGAAAVGVYMLAKHIFSVSQEEKDARKAYSDWQAQIISTFDSVANGSQKAEAGSEAWRKVNIEVRDAYVQLGLSATDAIADVGVALDATHNSAEAVNAATAKMSTLVNLTIDIATGVGKITDAWGQAGKFIPQDIQNSITKLLTMNGLTDDQRTKLQGLLDSAKPSFTDLMGIADKYKISLAQLGPTFQQQDLESKAKSLFQDFSQLEASGADINGVLVGMGPSFQDLVTQSQVTGSKIPQNMQPVLDLMAKNGLLTDQFGNKLKDTSTLSFEDTPLDKGLTTLSGSIDALVKVLEERLPAAIKALPDKTITIHGKYDIPDMPDVPGAWAGGKVLQFGVQHFAAGGFAMGSDTVPAMLTPGEMVLNASQQKNVARGLAGGGSNVVDMSAMRSELAHLRREQQRQNDYMQTQFRRDLAQAVVERRARG